MKNSDMYPEKPHKLEQIKKQRYADKYRALGKQIIGIGVNFDGKEREINEWVEETL